VTRSQRNANLGAVIIPFVGVIVAIISLWGRGVHAADLVVAFVLYILCGFGITVGFHRMLTHRAFQASKPVEYTFAILGSMAVQGRVIDWVADHRKHHAHSDEEGDPHSPHVGHGTGLRGLWHAHVGWLFTEHGRARRARYAPDLLEDRGMRRINRMFVWLVAATLLIPALVGYIYFGTLAGALEMFLWAGLVRVFFLHHITWSINSVCHYMGKRRFDVDDHSANVFWLAIPSLGEAWHHNHHAFPRSAAHGLRKAEVDPSAALIWVLEKLRIVHNVVRITPERQEQLIAAAKEKAAGAAAAAKPSGDPVAQT
jgi:stearoyl-CoA desaturase (delta-9 desaturase)